MGQEVSKARTDASLALSSSKLIQVSKKTSEEESLISDANMIALSKIPLIPSTLSVVPKGHAEPDSKIGPFETGALYDYFGGLETQLQTYYAAGAQDQILIQSRIQEMKKEIYRVYSHYEKEIELSSQREKEMEAIMQSIEFQLQQAGLSVSSLQESLEVMEKQSSIEHHVAVLDEFPQ